MLQISQLSSWFSRSELNLLMSMKIFNFVNATDFSAQFVIITKWAGLFSNFQFCECYNFSAQFVILTKWAGFFSNFQFCECCRFLSSVRDSQEVSWIFFKCSILWMLQISQLSSWFSRSELNLLMPTLLFSCEHKELLLLPLNINCYFKRIVFFMYFVDLE